MRSFGHLRWPPAARSDRFLVFVLFNIAGAALCYVVVYREHG